MSAVLPADFSRVGSITRKTAASIFEPREFPCSSAVPTLPISIPEEILDYYAFVFCQFGFAQLNMTFEQFLLVASSVRSAGLNAVYE
jgi:hypothetical protein